MIINYVIDMDIEKSCGVFDKIEKANKFINKQKDPSKYQIKSCVVPDLIGRWLISKDRTAAGRR